MGGDHHHGEEGMGRKWQDSSGDGRKWQDIKEKEPKKKIRR